MGNPIIYGIIRSFHDIASIIWIGSLFFISFFLVPKAKNLIDEEKRMIFLNGIFDRITPLIFVCIIILIVTGILEHRFVKMSGIINKRPVSGTYNTIHNIKYILTGLMVVIAALRQIMRKKMSKAGQAPKKKNPYTLIYMNTIIGIIVVFLSGILSALN